MDFVTITDSRFMPGTYALLNSLVKRSGINFNFKIFVYGVADLDWRERINSLKQCEFYNIQDLGEIKAKDVPERLIPSMQKILLFNLPVGKYAYIDSDIICLNNIGMIETFPHFSAVIDLGVTIQRSVAGRPQFNGGFFVFQPELVDYDDLFYYLKDYKGRLVLGDQTLLNNYFYTQRPESVNLLDYRWNVLIRIKKHYPAAWKLGEAKFLHYVGKSKPWDKEYDHELKSIWQKYGYKRETSVISGALTEDNDFIGLLKDKRVCLVGASQKLMETDQRELINSYDYVVRINWGFPIEDIIKDTTGERIDVLYVNLPVIDDWLDGNGHLYQKAVECGIQWIVTCIHNVNNRCWEFFEKMPTRIKYRALTGEFRKAASREVGGGSPNSGYLTVLDLLQCGVKELYVTGFDFYNGMYHSGYGKLSKTFKPETGQQDHNQTSHIRAFRRLTEIDDRIKVDDTLNKILYEGMSDNDRKYSQYLRGKTVCIIGPSESLLEQKQADYINYHDIVIRINSGYPIPENLLPFTGNRCDVLYQHAGTGVTMDETVLSNAVADGLQWVVYVHPEDRPAFEHVKNMCKDKVECRGVSKELRGELDVKMGTTPNAGQVAIRDLLYSGVKELYITGMDFYMGKYYKGYSEKEMTPGGHDQHKQYKAFIELCRYDGRIKLDKRLQGLVSVKSYFRNIVNERVTGRALEICRTGESIYSGKYDVYEETVENHMRRFFSDIDWNKYTTVLVHNSKFVKDYHKVFKKAREKNHALKIIMELNEDRDHRALWRICDRLDTRPEIELNVGII